LGSAFSKAIKALITLKDLTMDFRESGNRPIPLLRTPNPTERVLRRLFLDYWNLKLLALAITLGLWFAVNGQRAPITERFPNVQLNFQLPNDMGISNEPIDEIELTLTGAKRELDLINPRDLNATIDITDRRPGDRVVQLTPGRLKIDLPSGVRLEKIQPPSVQVRVEPILEREVEIEARLEGKLAAGYELNGVSLRPQRIRVRGPASHVNALTRVATETVLLDGRKEDFSVPQTAVDVPDQKLVVLDPVVDVFVQIRPLKLPK
jgi:YbbR domain-containing protein